METCITFKSTALHRSLLNLIESRLALVLNEHRMADVIRVIEELTADGQIGGPQDLANRLSALSTTHPLWQRVIRVATIGETYFFRDRSQIDALWYSVLPNLINERRERGQHHLRLWSAGCSTGEEPYSLAIILKELIPDIRAWDINIWATDINISHLQKAQQGLYRSWSFRSDIPQTVQRRWFTEVVDGFQIDASIREMVTFAPLNLAGSPYLLHNTLISDIDIILCRNVLIYFDKPTISTTIKQFHGALANNGWLVLGHSESSHMADQPFKFRNYEGAVLYQKESAETEIGTYTHALDPVDNVPVSKPTLLASHIKQKTPLSMQVREKQPEPAVVTTDKLDPWTLAHYAANKEDWTEALRWLTEAEVAHKLRPEIHYLRGIIELQQGEIEKSLASLRRAIYCKHDFVLAHFTLGEVFEKLGQFKKASTHWKQAQIILLDLPSDMPIEASDNLTVEMLSTVLEYRLENLIPKLPR